jgi:hypothetical protein
MDLLDLMRPDPIRRAVEPDGPVVREPQETLRFNGGKLWLYAEIQLHRDDASGLWMWSTSFGLPDGGSSYQVGSKWGHFAESRADALAHARAELSERLRRRQHESAAAAGLVARILVWAERLA